jgi:hypothetical protein
MALPSSFLTKLLAFCTAVETQSNARHQKQYAPHWKDEQVLPSLERVHKYIRIYFDNGTQKLSRYFVEVKTGNIYACEGWKKPNFRRQFGTLETIDQFDWSGYEGVALPTSNYVMRATVGPYATAVKVK